jgi:hypothetical protein
VVIASSGDDGSGAEGAEGGEFCTLEAFVTPVEAAFATGLL